MIKVNLATGKTVLVTFDQYMDDNFMQNLVGMNAGTEINDPFNENIHIPKFGRNYKEQEPEIEALPEEEVEKIEKEIEKEL